MKKRWQDIVIFVLGLWLMLSTAILPRTMDDHVLFNNSKIVGLLLMLVAFAAIVRPNAWKEWPMVVLAAWLISASYLLDNDLPNASFTMLAGNQLIVGLLVMVAAAFGLYRRRAIRDMDNTTPV